MTKKLEGKKHQGVTVVVQRLRFNLKLYLSVECPVRRKDLETANWICFDKCDTWYVPYSVHKGRAVTASNIPEMVYCDSCEVYSVNSLTLILICETIPDNYKIILLLLL